MTHRGRRPFRSQNLRVDDIAQFDRHRYISLTTFRRSGVEVRTPVWFEARDGKLYIFTAGGGGQNKRFRPSPRARPPPYRGARGETPPCRDRRRRQLALENFALRHRLAVYKRTVTRPRLCRTDRQGRTRRTANRAAGARHDHLDSRSRSPASSLRPPGGVVQHRLVFTATNARPPLLSSFSPSVLC